MSRIGKQPIITPKEVEVKLNKNSITVKGPKGELTLTIPAQVTVAQKDEVITVSVKDSKEAISQALWGTIQRLINNNITGVTQGFVKKLNITGVGYRASVQGKILTLEMGFSHPVKYVIPENIEVKVEGNNAIIISGIDKQKVGQVSAEIREIKKPEPYKGKGIAYEDEVVRRKAGKQATSSAGNS
jgi:large subunit ribosomal protein L6